MSGVWTTHASLRSATHMHAWLAVSVCIPIHDQCVWTESSVDQVAGVHESHQLHSLHGQGGHDFLKGLLSHLLCMPEGEEPQTLMVLSYQNAVLHIITMFFLQKEHSTTSGSYWTSSNRTSLFYSISLFSPVSRLLNMTQDLFVPFLSESLVLSQRVPLLHPHTVQGHTQPLSLSLLMGVSDVSASLVPPHWLWLILHRSFPWFSAWPWPGGQTLTSLSACWEPAVDADCTFHLSTMFYPVRIGVCVCVLGGGGLYEDNMVKYQYLPEPHNHGNYNNSW